MIATVTGLPWGDIMPLLLISIAAAVYVVKQGIEIAGVSPSANLLRIENADLVRRNHELEETVNRHAALIAELQREVEELRKTNQAAVLAALKDHEVGAKSRHGETTGLLSRAVNALEAGGLG